MTSLQKIFVLAAALVLALTVGGGAGFAQDGEIVGIEYSFVDLSVPPNVRPLTRFNIDRAVGSAEGVTVDLAADTVRLGPGKYWFSTPMPEMFPSARFLPLQGKIASERPSK